MLILLLRVWKIWSATHVWCPDFISWWSEIGHHLCLRVFFDVFFFLIVIMLEVGTIFPTVLSCFLFSSGASTRFQLMAFTYGVSQSHSLDTHMHTHGHTHVHARTRNSSGRVISPLQRTLCDSTHRDKHPCPRWDSSLQSQQTKGPKPTPCTVQSQLIPQFTYLNRRQWRSIVTWMFFPNESHPSAAKL